MVESHVRACILRSPGGDELREWTGLSALDEAGVDEQLGMLFDVEAERRRGVIWGAAGRLDRPAP